MDHTQVKPPSLLLASCQPIIGSLGGVKIFHTLAAFLPHHAEMGGVLGGDGGWWQ